MFFGILLVLFGLLWLLEELGVIRGDVWEFMLPIIVIALGVSTIFNARKRSH